jgi:hypothetical protein
VFQFGEELDHLEAAEADVVLGRPAVDRRRRRRVPPAVPPLPRRPRHPPGAPAYTVMTADKDDPRFDEFYRGATRRGC